MQQMSLAIEGDFAEKYKKFKGTDHFLVSAHGIGHYFMEWMDAWIMENPNNKLAKNLNGPHRSVSSIGKVFNIFIGRLKTQSVEMPNKLKAEVLREYLAD